MKKFIIIFSVLISLQLKAQNTQYSHNNTDSLKQKIDSLNQYISELKQKFPNVLIRQLNTAENSIKLYIPFGLKTEITCKRPTVNDSIYFCIPAAYTAKDTTIDGLYILNGMVIDSVFNEKLTGACILGSDNVKIIRREELSKNLINEVITDSLSFFQQSILIRNSEIIPCTLFKERKNLRRALVKFSDFYCIAESISPSTIMEFQQYLLKSGAIDAIYLDMGTWSEGWYKDNNCRIIKIGEKFYNTHLQTNWLIFKLSD